MSYRGLFSFLLFLIFRSFCPYPQNRTPQVSSIFSPLLPYLPNPLLEASLSSASGQASGLLVPVSSAHLCACTPGLSTSYSLRGLLIRISHLEGGFTLRCLQRLSLPGLATLPWGWSPTGTPAARPSRSSRTKDSSSQISSACAG